MPLWGNRDLASGNQKPVFANTSPTTSSSTINGAAANTAKYYGNVWGVSATEEANTQGDGPRNTHAGWVSQKIGTGPVTGLNISVNGAGYSAGFLSITGGGGSGANASFTVNGSGNVTSVTLNSGGSGYTSAPTVIVPGSNTAIATIIATVGGRAGRRQYETLVAMGSITDDNAADNTYFPGT